MDGPLNTTSQPPAKRIKLSYSPGLNHNREVNMYSQQVVWYETPISQQQQEPSPYSSGQQQSHQPVTHTACASPFGSAMTNSNAANGSTGEDCWSNNTLFDPTWRWPPSASQSAPLSPAHRGAFEDNLGIRQVSPLQQHSPASGALEVETKPLPTTPGK